MGEAKRRKGLDPSWGTVPRERASKMLSLEEFHKLFNLDLLEYIEADYQQMGRILYKAERDKNGRANLYGMTLSMSRLSNNPKLVELIETYNPEKEFLMGHRGGDVMIHSIEAWRTVFQLQAEGQSINPIDTMGSIFALKV